MRFPYLTRTEDVDLAAGPLRPKAKFGAFVLGTSGPARCAASAKHPAACVADAIVTQSVTRGRPGMC